MIKKGTVVVRTNNSNTTSDKEYAELGYIFSVLSDSKAGYAEYHNEGYMIQKNHYRLATKAEIDFFNEGGTNINDMKKDIVLDNFSVKINYDKEDFLLYKSLCEKYNIKLSKYWDGLGTWYGLAYGTPQCKAKSHGDIKFESVQEFEQFLINNKQTQNETSKIITTGQRETRKGQAIISSRTRQTAIGSRLTGNSSSAKYQEIRIAKSQISSSAITI